MKEFSADLHRLRLIHDEIFDYQKKIIACLDRLDDENLINFTISPESIFSNETKKVLRNLTLVIGEVFCKEFDEKQKNGDVK